MKWRQFLANQQVSVSQSEWACVDAFDDDPEGPAYFSMAQVLYQHGFHDEAIETLLVGLERYPGDVVARVWLSQYLYRRLLIGLAWQIIDGAAYHDLEDNAMGWGLRFKLAVLLGYAQHAAEAVAAFERMSCEAQLRQLMRVYALQGEDAAQALLADELDTPLPKLSQLVYEQRQWLSHEGDCVVQSAPGEPAAVDYMDAASLAWRRDADQKHAGSASTARIIRGGGAVPVPPKYAGFYALPLHEVGCVPPSHTTAPFDSDGRLDSQTMAAIFEKQGYDERAVAIYRRLLAKHPAHEGYRKHLARLERKLMSAADLTHRGGATGKQQPGVAMNQAPLAAVRAADEVMGAVVRRQQLDHKAQFLQSLLERIPAAR